MKLIITLMLFISVSFANYSVYFTGIKLGVAKNFDTLKDNYLKAEVTNSIARFLLGKDTFVFYDENFSLKKDTENIKYKKDKYAIIEILKRASNNNIKDERIQLKKDKYIDVKFDKNYKFTYTSKGKIKSNGYFIMKEGKLIKLVENINNIEISKND